MYKEKKTENPIKRRLQRAASIFPSMDEDEVIGFAREMIDFPRHMRDSAFWILYGSELLPVKYLGSHTTITYPFKIGPKFYTYQSFEPYDLRCNCCFVCSWLLRITVLPIVKVINFFEMQYKKINIIPLRYE